MNEKVLQAVIKLKDQITTPLRNVNKTLNDTSKKFKEVSEKVKDVSDKMKDMGAKVTVAGTAITGTLTAITGAYVNQATEIDKISKMAGMTTLEYQKWD